MWLTRHTHNVDGYICEYLTQILPGKCLGNMKNFRHKYLWINSTDVSNVDLLPQREQIHTYLSPEPDRKQSFLIFLIYIQLALMKFVSSQPQFQRGR